MNALIKITLTLLIICCLPAYAYSSKSSKTILITASTGSLGSATAHDLAKQGYNLILTGRNETKLKKLEKDLTEKFAIQITTVKFDYSDDSSIQTAANSLANSSINGLVLIPPRSLFTTRDIPPASEWRKNLEEGFIGPVEFLRAIKNKLAPEATVIIISGATSKYYIADYPNSNVIKIMWSAEIKNLCRQFSIEKVRINAISPGLILTEHNIKKIKDRASQSNRIFATQLAEETKLLPTQKYGQPQDVTSLIAFLISNDSRHINCENILLDGGASTTY